MACIVKETAVLYETPRRPKCCCVNPQILRPHGILDGYKKLYAIYVT